MIRSLKDLQNYTFEASDGDVGRVNDFYFDDRGWKVRYMVLETGRWLPGRRVLVSPHAIRAAHWDRKRVRLALTKEQIESSPGAELNEPVSRQHLAALHAHYGWPIYWNAGPTALESSIPFPMIGRRPEDAPPRPDVDVHLRSVDEVLGYDIAAEDGSIGEVSDFGVDESDWTIRYLVIDTRKWLPGKRVVLSPDWAHRVDWEKGQVHVDLPVERIERSPAFDPDRDFDREYEEVVYDFYGRPRYWVTTDEHEHSGRSS